MRTRCAHPSIELKNYGNNAIASAQVVIKQGGITLETRNFTLNLAPLATQIVNFSPLTINESSQFSFEVVLTNGGADGNGLNNMLEQSVFVPMSLPTPIVENFNDLPDRWISTNPDGLFSWEIANVPMGTTPNKALLMNFYDYEDSEGEIDLFITPLIDLTDVPDQHPVPPRILRFIERGVCTVQQVSGCLADVRRLKQRAAHADRHADDSSAFHGNPFGFHGPSHALGE